MQETSKGLEAAAKLYFIVKACCREYPTGLYEVIDFMDLKWIVDRCNWHMGTRYGLGFVSYGYLSMFEEAEISPADIDMKLWKNKPQDYVSQAEMEAIKKYTRRWKIYGRICVWISQQIWTKYYLKRLKNSQNR